MLLSGESRAFFWLPGHAEILCWSPLTNTNTFCTYHTTTATLPLLSPRVSTEMITDFRTIKPLMVFCDTLLFSPEELCSSTPAAAAAR